MYMYMYYLHVTGTCICTRTCTCTCMYSCGPSPPPPPTVCTNKESGVFVQSTENLNNDWQESIHTQYTVYSHHLTSCVAREIERGEALCSRANFGQSNGQMDRRTERLSMCYESHQPSSVLVTEAAGSLPSGVTEANSEGRERESTEGLFSHL